jgi:hypothetical protein
MGKKVIWSQTFSDHPHLIELKALLQEQFVDLDLVQIEKEIVSFIVNNSLSIGDFPLLNGTYTRTILYRHEGGFEAMAARWSRGAVSSIHGHPSYTF